MRAGGRTRVVVALFTALVPLSACADDGGPVAIGAPLPDYAAVSLGGETVALREFRGDALLLNIWASWCPACEREMPSLQALHEELGPRGLRVVGVSVDPPGSEMRVREFLEKYGISYMILYDPRDRVSKHFRIIGIPTTYLANRRGIVREVWIGEKDFGAQPIKAALDRALADERGAKERERGNDRDAGP